MDQSLLSALHEIHYEEGDLQALASTPLYFNCGVQLLCTCGEGLLSTGAQQFHLHKMSELIFWGGSIMQLLEASDDFHVRMLLYPKKVFLQAAIALDTTYFNYMEEFPLYNHEEKAGKHQLMDRSGRNAFHTDFLRLQRENGTEFPAKYADVDFQHHS